MIQPFPSNIDFKKQDYDENNNLPLRVFGDVIRPPKAVAMKPQDDQDDIPIYYFNLDRQVFENFSDEEVNQLGLKIATLPRATTDIVRPQYVASDYNTIITTQYLLHMLYFNNICVINLSFMKVDFEEDECEVHFPYSCLRLEKYDTSLDISSFMEMFNGNFEQLRSIRRISFNEYCPVRLLSIHQMFKNMPELEEVDFGNWRFPKWVIKDENCFPFVNCPRLENITISDPNVTDAVLTRWLKHNFNNLTYQRPMTVKEKQIVLERYSEAMDSIKPMRPVEPEYKIRNHVVFRIRRANATHLYATYRKPFIPSDYAILT